MNFANRMQEQAQAQDMSEKRITAAEFDDAVKQVMEKMMDDERITGAAKTIMPLTGMLFAREMQKILFGEEE